jgi:hypothetical protein
MKPSGKDEEGEEIQRLLNVLKNMHGTIFCSIQQVHIISLFLVTRSNPARRCGAMDDLINIYHM